jgi:hypothetical protein
MTQRIKTDAEDQQEHALSSQSHAHAHIHAQHEGESPAIQAQDSAASPPGLNTSKPTSASSTSSPLPPTSSPTRKSQSQQPRYETRGGRDVYSPDHYSKVSTYLIGFYWIMLDFIGSDHSIIRLVHCLYLCMQLSCLDVSLVLLPPPPSWNLGLLPWRPFHSCGRATA